MLSYHLYFKTFLPPATKLGQGNIFRSVCQEFCPQKGAYVAWGHAWQGGCAWQGGMHGRRVCVAGGCAWQGGRAWQILRDTVNERAVRILLECILVITMFLSKVKFAPVHGRVIKISQM